MAILPSPANGGQDSVDLLQVGAAMDFEGSRIHPEIVALNFRTVRGANIYEYLAIGCTKRRNDGRLPDAWLKQYRHCEAGGWWCSGVDLVKGEDLLWGCFKPNNPRIDEWGLKPIKYEHPKGVATNVFALKVGETIAQKIGERFGVSLSPETFWEDIKANPSIPVIITEGAKKAACLLSAGFVAIGLPGIWGAYRKELLKTETQGLLPPVYALGERRYIFVFDQDAKDETQKAVKSAINTTAKAIKRNFPNAPSPLSLRWDEEYKGVDDLIFAKGAPYFEALWDDILKKAQEKEALQVNNQDGEGDEPISLKQNKKALEFIKGLWGGKLALNVRSLEIELEGKPIDCDAIHLELADKHNANITKDRAIDCVYYLAKQKEYDPFLDYLKTLENLPSAFTKANLASDLFGTKDPYHCEILWLFLLAVVKRAYEPGAKWDNAFVLQGKQGIGKSSFFRALVGEQFFSAGMKGDVYSADNLRILHNHVIVEWAELESFTAKTYEGTIKHFLSLQEDSFRLPYARQIHKVPRREVIVGTVNPEQFLTDTTGNRRFMVIPVSWILPPPDVETLRGEIFAPVIRDYLENWQGPHKYLELPPPLQTRQAQENEGYLQGDILNEAIQDVMHGKDNLYFTMGEIMGFLQDWRKGLLKLDFNRGTQMRVGKALNQYGWGSTQRKIDGKNQRVWVKRER